MRTEPGATVKTVLGNLSPRARILLPIALSVGVLALFLLLFLPSKHGQKGNKGTKAGNRSGHSAGYHEYQAVEGNSAVTEGKGGSGAARPNRKGENWWYKEKEAKSGGDADQWWYKEKPGSKSGKSGSSQSPVGGS